MTFTHRHHARVTLEFTTPFHIGAGRSDVSDALVVRDANGLPALPGSSLAGVLRAQFPVDWADKLFGFQKGDNGEGSRLSITWGHIHNASNIAVEGLQSLADLQEDNVLQNAMMPAIRDHVRLDHRGVAADKGKFDEEVLPAGHRFTFAMELLDDGTALDEWKNLLGALSSPGFRLGGKTRRGFGAIRVVNLQTRSFDLTDAVQLRDWLALSPRLDKIPEGFDAVAPESSSSPHREYSLKLKPRGFWMFGGGVDDNAERDSDHAPVRESRIRWDDKGSGTVEEVWVFPGSSVKGCIAHRFAYHHRRRNGQWAGTVNPEASCPAVQLLFGSEGEKNDEGETVGMCRGRVLIDDLAIPCKDRSAPKPQLVHHVAIDAFTGGARDSLLFAELPLYQGPELTWQIAIEDPDSLESADEKLLPALEDALADLCEGRLAMGAGRGKGFFEGRFELQGDSNHV